MNTKSVEPEQLLITLKGNSPNFFQQILNVNAAPVTLSYLFHNIRNYALATPIVIAGLWLLTEGNTLFDVPYINIIFGIHILICGLILIGLNFIHSILTFSKSPGRSWPAYIIFITLLVSTAEVVWISFWKLYG